MFDASFLELLVVSVIALLVLGPERLPGAIKTVGLWVGRIRRSFNNIKRDIEKEIGADDIRRQLRNEAIMEKFDSTKSQFTKTVDSIKKETATIKNDLDFKKEVTGFMGEGDKAKAKSIPKASQPLKSSKESTDSTASKPESDTPQTPQAPTSTSNTSQTTPDLFSDEKESSSATADVKSVASKENDSTHAGEKK